MFSRGNIIQRVIKKIFVNRISFSRAFQFPSANLSTFLVKTLSDTRSPRSSANRPNLLKTLALLSSLPRFHSFHSFGSQLTIARVARTRPLLIDPRPFVTAAAGKWSPFTCRAGKNLAFPFRGLFAFYATRNSIYSVSIRARRRRGEIVDLFLFHRENFPSDTP